MQFGRRALAAKPGDADTVNSMLAAFRSLDPRRGIAFGEHWLSRHGTRAEVCRHLSFLYDDLNRPAEALAVARRGLAVAPRDLRLAGCVANYLAKAEGAESALRFAAAQGLTGDTYAENTLAHGLSSAGAYAESEKLFETLLRRQPWEAKTCVALLDARYPSAATAEIDATILGESRGPWRGDAPRVR